MDSLGRFFVKRYGYALAFAAPVIVGAIAIGVLSNVLDARGASQGMQDGVAIVGMLILMLALGIVIIVRRPLPGIFGKWQGLWNKIPTWRARLAERAATTRVV